MPVNNR